MQRRHFLRAAGVSLALPLLDRFAKSSIAADTQEPPRRVVFICTTLGLHGPNFFPSDVGSDYKPTRYLEELSDHRRDFTVFSGLSHPDQSGANGHSSEKTWLTSARHPGLGGFRNSISVDQLAAERLGYTTRFPSLILGTSNNSLSYTRSGVMIPAQQQPSKVFAELFLDGSDDEMKRQVQRLREGRSILDTVGADARRLASSGSAADQQRLDEYFESVRELERKLEAAEAWVQRPKASVDAEPPTDVSDASALIARTELMFEVIPLALQTDSTRVIAMTMNGRNDVPDVDGVDIDHHNLSHHGQDQNKLEQLERIELQQMKTLAKLLKQLATKDEAGRRLLDSTTLVFGSNLGNANSHDWRNLPILLAGGGHAHGQHRAFDADNNLPLSNLFLSLLQNQGHEIELFGSSTGTIDLG